MAREIKVYSSDLDEPRSARGTGMGGLPRAFAAMPAGEQGDDNPGGGAPLYIMAVRRYVGPITYCGFTEFVSPEGWGPRFFAAYSVSGETWTKFSVSPHCPDATCDTSADNVGVSKAVFSGSVTIDPSDCSQSGVLQLLFSAKGSLPHTSWMQPGYDLANVFTYNGASLGGLLAQVNGWVIWLNRVDTPNVRYYSTPSGNNGCFILQGPGRGIGCSGYSVFETVGSEISPGDLGYAVYDSVKTQTIISYDSIAQEYTGHVSEIRISAFFPGATTEATAVMRFKVEPTGGGDITYLTETVRLTGVPGQFNNSTYQFPRIIGYDVTYLSGQVIYSDELFDTFSQDGEDGQIVHSLAPIGSWENSTTFITTQPASIVSSDFEDYTGELGLPIDTITVGYDWDADGEFITAFTDYVSDSFEGYAVGDPVSLQYGIGWDVSGYFLQPPADSARDDFESYTVGAITSLPAALPSPSNDNLWGQLDGEFIDDTQLYCSDNFESYSTGAITDLNQGFDWAADGYFIN